MRRILALFKLICLLGSTLAVYTIYLVGFVPTLVAAGSRRWWRGLCFAMWGRSVALSLGIRRQIEGTPPEAPFFLVSNHVSYLDIPMFATCLNGYFVAKAEVAGWPLVGLLARSIGTLFIDRAARRDVARVNHLAQPVLDRGIGVIVFPEGTSTDGSRVQTFKPGLLELPASRGLGVHVAAIRYSVPPGEIPARESVCWWGSMEFLPHVRQLLQVRGIAAHIRFGDDVVHGEERKDLAFRLRDSVTQLLGQDPDA